MSTRRPTRPGQLDIQFEPPSDRCLTLTKGDVVIRHLDTASRLWLSDGDPVSIHLLTWAAIEIIAPIGKDRNERTYIDQFEDRIFPEYVESWRAMMKNSYNFFKHGSRDLGTTNDRFNPEVNEILLALTVLDAVKFFERKSIAGMLHVAVFFGNRPSMIIEDGRPIWDPIIYGVAPKGATSEQRKASAREMLSLHDLHFGKDKLDV